MKMLLFLRKYRKINTKEKQLCLKLLLFVFFNTTGFAENEAVAKETSNQIKKELSNSLSKNEKVADSLLLLSETLLKDGSFDKAFQLANKSLELFNGLGKTKKIGDCNIKIALIFYYQTKYPKALQYYDRSIIAFKKVDAKEGLASAINNKGAIYYYLGNYPKALDCYRKAVKLDKDLNNKVNAAVTIQNIGGIYFKLEDYANAMKYLQIAKKTFENVSNFERLSQVLNGIGEIHAKKNHYDKAAVYYGKALKLAQRTNDKQRILEAFLKHGELYDQQNEVDQAFFFFNKSLALSQKLNSPLFIARSLIAMGVVQYKLGKNRLAIQNCKNGLRLAKDLEILVSQKEACSCLYDTYKAMDNTKAALSYYEMTTALNDSLQTQQTTKSVLNMEFDRQILKDSIFQVEKERKVQLAYNLVLVQRKKQRNVLIISGCFLLVFAGGLWSRLKYTKKAKVRLQVEKDRSEHLLLNILPEEIAEELKEKGYVDAQDFETAAILFTDFKSFTETAAKLSPQELVEEINVCFKAFDAIMGIYDIEKIKTIGDAYMAVGGLPKPEIMAVKNTILAALEMQAFVIKRKIENTSQNKPSFDMRVGIHVGPIIAGIVGVKKFQYDVWGDTVNTASRMESNGDIDKVNISQDTYDLVKSQKDLVFEYRGKIAVKGKGELAMYFVSKN